MLDFSLKTEKPLTTGAWVEGLTMGLAYFIGTRLDSSPSALPPLFRLY